MRLICVLAGVLSLSLLAVTVPATRRYDPILHRGDCLITRLNTRVSNRESYMLKLFSSVLDFQETETGMITELLAVIVPATRRHHPILNVLEIIF